jgi:hypothetical protein
MRPIAKIGRYAYAVRRGGHFATAYLLSPALIDGSMSIGANLHHPAQAPCGDKHPAETSVNPLLG